MKIKNFTIYFFAVIGFVVIACSAAAATESIDDNPVDNPPVVQSSIGKYQMTTHKHPDRVYHLNVLNTETGVVKLWLNNTSSSTTLNEWKLMGTLDAK